MSGKRLIWAGDSDSADCWVVDALAVGAYRRKSLSPSKCNEGHTPGGIDFCAHLSDTQNSLTWSNDETGFGMTLGIPPLTCTNGANTPGQNANYIVELEERLQRAPVSPPKRFERRDVKGTEGAWQVNSAGRIYRGWRLQPIGDDIGGLPTIDFGNRYIGDLIVPAYIGPVPSSGHRSDTCRLLDEIVCYAFHGYPPGGFRASRVLHLDGNQLECAADNLQWQVDAEYLVNEEEKAVRGWMRPDFLPHRVTIQPTTRARKELAWVEGQSVPGWTPVKEKKAV